MVTCGASHGPEQLYEPVRAAVCSGWEFLGLQLDPEKNADTPTDVDVAANKSAVRVLVIHTQEDWQIAVECFRLTKALFPARSGLGEL